MSGTRRFLTALRRVMGMGAGRVRGADASGQADVSGRDVAGRAHASGRADVSGLDASGRAHAAGRADASGRAHASGRADASGAPGAASVSSPGQTGASATVELDPRRVGRVRFAYAPERDGEPDPGEIVWTWVPYEERDGRGKDRPVAIVAAGAPGEYLAVQLTSKPHDEGDRYVPLGAGAWDAEGRPSWARIDRVYRVRAGGMRREGATLDRAPYDRLTAALAARHGWR